MKCINDKGNQKAKIPFNPEVLTIQLHIKTTIKPNYLNIHVHFRPK